MFPAFADFQPLLVHKPRLRMHKRKPLSGRVRARTAEQSVQDADNHAVPRAVNAMFRKRGTAGPCGSSQETVVADS